MVKLDYERDYYADLELPATADATEVKKQFKKLALRWHPDRNPGKEEEAKEKFLVIQAAHEILTDPVTKSKFDAYRLRTRPYPAASGIRGNPWQYTAQEVNQRFGAPPRRSPMPTRPTTTTAGSRYRDWGQASKTKAENFKANVDAWNRSRPQPKTSQPSATAAASAAREAAKARETAAPRNAAQARRQEASFGTRRSGFAPTSPAGDEPPVKNQHYNANTTTASDQSAAQARKSRPTSVFVDPPNANPGKTFLDSRQSTPYSANVGEKTNPFEPLNVNRAKSMRDGARRFQDGGHSPPTPPPRPRSASVGPDNTRRSTNDTPGFAESRPSASPFQSRASARYSPRAGETNSAPATATFPAPNSSASPANSGANVNSGIPAQPGNGTKVYESPASSQYHGFYSGYLAELCPQTPHSSSRVGEGSTRAQGPCFPAHTAQQAASTPSGELPGPGPNALESRIHAQLQLLLGRKGYQPFKPPAPSAKDSAPSPKSNRHRINKRANTTHTTSFTVPDDDPTSPPHQARFTRSSADNINTRFVADEKGSANFQFSAGSESSAEDGFLRAKNRARGHQSPLRNEFTSSSESFAGAPQHNPQQNPQQNEGNQKQGDFVPEAWKEAFGPHIFEPPQPSKSSASPSRPIRPLKKQRPVRMTAGTAGLVDDEETSSEERGQASAATGGIDRERSPNAMDIDTPPPEPSGPQTNGARNIPVEPTKPEWRAGNVNGVNPDPKLGANLKMPSVNPNAAGSEDSEDFLRPIFSEFRNVEPFAQKVTGLGSLADLGSNLPFPSRPSAKPPLAQEGPKPEPIPSPPPAPRPSPGLVISGTRPGAPEWQTYVREFETYMTKWYAYCKKMTNHFSKRQSLNERNGLGWLNMQGDAGAQDYLQALEEDKYIRQKWMAACDAHELHFREYLRHRERMKRQM
ncbi:DnaJ-related protein rsp1 [Madurella mycetomatis]|uniref:DnaJ-related protein rsp1 n=1 Tax=Madurella mycetomatis TaxID=100816 RepID=A0A175W2S8_9PEZI|nr:DnaJ-related protein rsp1 [Madurella mycetomatis]